MKDIAKKALKFMIHKGGKDSVKKIDNEDFPYMNLIDKDCILFYKGNSFYGQTTILGAIEMLQEFGGYRMNEETYKAIAKKYDSIASA